MTQRGLPAPWWSTVIVGSAVAVAGLTRSIWALPPGPCPESSVQVPLPKDAVAPVPLATPLAYCTVAACAAPALNMRPPSAARGAAARAIFLIMACLLFLVECDPHDRRGAGDSRRGWRCGLGCLRDADRRWRLPARAGRRDDDDQGDDRQQAADDLVPPYPFHSFCSPCSSAGTWTHSIWVFAASRIRPSWRAGSVHIPSQDGIAAFCGAFDASQHHAKSIGVIGVGRLQDA